MSKYNLIDIYEQYRIGSGWTTDFDYEGMLKAGLKTGVDTDLELLEKMVEDYTDVNYHREADHLYKAIEALKQKATKEASMFFGDFHAEIKATMADLGIGVKDDTLGQFMASKMEEEMAVFSSEEEEDKYIEKKVKRGLEKEKERAAKKKKGVKEITSREGAHIEGLLNINMKAKFLEAFADLYFNLTDEDPFQAEDVVDHLANEMLKHLDAIQAQGDKLNSTNTDADFEREQRMQMDMREEKMSLEDIVKSTKVDGTMEDLEKAVMAKAKKSGLDVTDKEVEDAVEKHADMALGLMEEIGPTGIAISQKQLDDLEKLGAISGLEVIVQDKDGSNVRKVDYTLTNTNFEKGDDDYDYLDENLKEHFGRFMKDYQ